MASAGLSSPVLPMHSAITLSAVGLIVLGLGIVVFRDQRLVAAVPAGARRAATPSSLVPGSLHRLQAVRVKLLQVRPVQAAGCADRRVARRVVTLDLAPAAGMSTPNVSSILGDDDRAGCCG